MLDEEPIVGESRLIPSVDRWLQYCNDKSFDGFPQSKYRYDYKNDEGITYNGYRRGAYFERGRSTRKTSRRKG